MADDITRIDIAHHQPTATEDAHTIMINKVSWMQAAGSVVSNSAIKAFIVLGAVAGWLGGRSGVVHLVYADRLIPTRDRVAEARRT